MAGTDGLRAGLRCGPAAVRWRPAAVRWRGEGSRTGRRDEVHALLRARPELRILATRVEDDFGSALTRSDV